MNQPLRKTSISLQDAEEQLGIFVTNALQERFQELRKWAESAPVTMRSGSPVVKIDAAREATQQFMKGTISLGKFGELLGIKPGELHDFKNAILRVARSYDDNGF